MKIALVYVYAPHCGPDYEWTFPYRFLQSYHQFRTTMDHQSVIVCNSGPPSPEAEVLFSSLPNCTFLQHDNSGFDIGAFQHAALVIPCDLMIFFGTTTHICGPGWLERVVDSVQKHGDTLYGSMVNSGDYRVGVWPHIRTTGFWSSPNLMNRYPHRVTRPEQRYAFEHHQNCLTQWVRRSGKAPLLVTWQGEFTQDTWRYDHRGFHQGDQAGLIFADRLCEPPYH